MSSVTTDRRWANLELIILGFIVSLTLKGVLDAAYSKDIGLVATWRGFYEVVIGWHSLQVFIFLLTLIRFVYGAYRFLENMEDSSEELERWVLVCNIPGTIILFVLLYMTGLAVRHPEPFYTGLIAVHAWDFIWFSLHTVFSDRIKKEVKTIMRRFLVIDIVTVVLLLLSLRSEIKGAVVMVLMAALDLTWNRTFFFYPARWRAERVSTAA